MGIIAIIGAAVLLSATYIFEVRPALDEREIRREMARHAGTANPT